MSEVDDDAFTQANALTKETAVTQCISARWVNSAACVIGICQAGTSELMENVALDMTSRGASALKLQKHTINHLQDFYPFQIQPDVGSALIGMG